MTSLFPFKVMSYFSPTTVLNVSVLSPYLTLQGSPDLERMTAFSSCPSFHEIETSKFPLAQIPLIKPFAHASGKAGSNWMNPMWLCNNISVIPAVPPKFPSIWNGA